MLTILSEMRETLSSTPVSYGWLRGQRITMGIRRDQWQHWFDHSQSLEAAEEIDEIDLSIAKIDEILSL